jgi:hypothetical protein
MLPPGSIMNAAGVPPEHGELRRFQHLDVDVGVAAGERRQPAGLGEDVLGLAGAQVQTAE